MKIGDAGRIPDRDQAGEPAGNAAAKALHKAPHARVPPARGLLDGLRPPEAGATRPARPRTGVEAVVEAATHAAALHRARYVPADPSSSRQRVKHMLQNAVRPGGASRVLVVGYAPFEKPGAASVDPLMEAVSRGLSEGRLSAGSVVVMHLSDHLLRAPHAAGLERLLRALDQHEVHVIAARVDKAVYGDFGGDEGGGPEAPRRIGSVLDCALRDGASLRDDVPVLSSRKLFRSMRAELTDDGMASKVFVLADPHSTALRDASESKVKPLPIGNDPPARA